MDVSSVTHWVHRFKSGERDIADRPRSDQPATTVTTGTKARLMCSFRMILGERCHSQFRAMCADIKEVKTMNSKGWAKQKDESSPPPA